MRQIIFIASPILYVLTCFISFIIGSSSHNVSRPIAHNYDAYVIIIELTAYFLLLMASKRTSQNLRTILIIFVAIVLSIELAWQTTAYTYNILNINLSFIPHLILVDLIPLYILLLITYMQSQFEKGYIENSNKKSTRN